MNRLATIAAAILVGLMAVSPASANQWKWRDANGRIIYSDRPPPASIPQRWIMQRPPGLSREPVPPSPTGPSLVPGAPAVVELPASAASAPPAEPELEARRKQEAAAEAAKRQSEEAQVSAAKADNCSRARNQLKLLDDGVRIARTNAKGEREILDDKARAAEKSRVQQIIAKDCAN